MVSRCVLCKLHLSRPTLHTCRGNMHATIFSTHSRSVCFVDGRRSYWGSQHSRYLPVAAIDKNGPGRTTKTSADRRANARGRYQYVPAVWHTGASFGLVLLSRLLYPQGMYASYTHKKRERVKSSKRRVKREKRVDGSNVTGLIRSRYSQCSYVSNLTVTSHDQMQPQPARPAYTCSKTGYGILVFQINKL